MKKGKSRLVKAVFFLLLFTMLSGCSKLQDEPEPELEIQSEEPVGDYVEKEVPEEGPFTDNAAIYEADDETSVVTMYLTVSSGNASDNTNHTWSEINQYSTYYYEENDLERYNVDAILQIGDETGPTAGEFGYGETIPNAAVQVRGQTSSYSSRKNYKVRIKEGKGEWRGQRTLALNKHVGDPLRFRNKLAYDLMKEVPQMMSARTQFVHLYVKDLTEGGNKEFEDYGLYTQVEQINKTYLKNHGLDSRGQLYKINFFEWRPYDEVMKLATDADYDRAAFERYIEIKGNNDHSKLQEVLEKLNNYSIPVREIVEEHFDVENICYWMAFHILIGNYDSGSRNAYIYSPLNSDKWYFISWDNDASFSRTYHRLTNYVDGQSWERGMTQYVGLVLANRMFREKDYREALTKAVEDLKNNYLTKEKVNQMAQAYAKTVKPYLYAGADADNALVDEQKYQRIVDGLGEEIGLNYSYYQESLKKPWPFYVGLPQEKNGKLQITWDISFDMNDEDIMYNFVLSSDCQFRNVLFSEQNVRIPQVTMDILPPGLYFIRVRAVNESGYEQDCFDYFSVSGAGKYYGARAFYVWPDGSISEYDASSLEIAEATEQMLSGLEKDNGKNGGSG